MATTFAKYFARELLALNRSQCKTKIFIRNYPKQDSLVPELFPQRLILPENHGYVPVLSKQQINTLLGIHESEKQTKTPGSHVIRGFHSNELSSNVPIEDRRTQAKLLQTNGTLYSVIDGHGGCACAQGVKERLLNYIAVSLLPPQGLEMYGHALKTDLSMDLLEWHFNNNCYVNEDMVSLHRSILQRYVDESLSMDDFDDDGEHHVVAKALRSAFLRLDNDFSTESMPMSGALNMDAMEIAFSGACAIVAHISDLDIHVANVGDTRAVLGQYDGQNWTAQALSTDHNTSNPSEVTRVKLHHPSEDRSVIRNNRLLGQLIPLRAFGDMRYKWSMNNLRNIVNILDTPYARNIIPSSYYTPPYLICKPEIMHHQLTSRDKFLVLATDGLWEQLSDEKVVETVGAFLEGKETEAHYKPASTVMTLGDINEQLLRRKHGLANKSTDQNSATHLIRHALGLEHHKVSEMLTLPHDVVRYYRDDISITVIFFDSDFVQKHENK